jgi:hypothetical protein
MLTSCPSLNWLCRYVLERFDGSPEAATSAVQPLLGAIAGAGGATAGAAAAQVTLKRKQQASGVSGTAGPASTKRGRVTPAATAGGAAPPPSPAVMVGEGAGGGSGREATVAAAGGGKSDIQALFKLQENNQVTGGK